MKRVLLLATTTGYQTRMFGEAAERLGVKLVFATDRCDQLDDPWWDGAIPVRFHQEATTVHAIVTEAERSQIDGLLAVGDRPTVAAAYAARLLGLTGNPPDAVKAARDKRVTRARLRDAGLRVPDVTIVARFVDPNEVVERLRFPVVIKPAVLSGSRGVIRADDRASFIAAFNRLQRLLETEDVRALHDSAADAIIVESFIPGREFALEGLLEEGRLYTLAIFEKPDPLDGPFFEETIYVTPPRASEPVQAMIRDEIAAAARALGLHHGPVHAECRVNEASVFVLEVAARPIGGLCARALIFTGADGASAGLEELLLRHALGEPIGTWRLATGATGVMMIPIPEGGVYRRVDGMERALQVPHIWEIRITAKPDQTLVPIPEGASYLGFIFARAGTPDAVEHALREAHAALAFVIDRALPLAGR
ncbi:MAG TPA: ATP-grasp domain-containing protein [Vicinamibacterales bacterium]|nr:ATP-grasp domain-containing protein [Vicinamibacterales bacterium]